MSGNQLGRLGNKKVYNKGKDNTASLSHDEITHMLLQELIFEIKQMKLMWMEAMEMDLEDLDSTEL
jgi:hypothetical protein